MRTITTNTAKPTNTSDSWGVVPQPFNPIFNPEARQKLETICADMDSAGYYEDHTREECAEEVLARMAKM